MLSLAPITGLGFEHVVCTENQDPAILVMEAAKDRLCCDGTEALNRPMERGILVRRAVNSRLIVIGGIIPKDPAQVRLNVEAADLSRHGCADQRLQIPEPFAISTSV